ncbi:VOC family protein [Leptospira sp. GIMC2001]|uniref:VOC family protein n=1 Tax=Leptospira sp. GIMC2001 TaxID=1513297 RepID=UPI00234A6C06|nr:VOC family protein [Leptospira sp. GIMC2001]WCL50609.1 hypothetical protein O4O04_07275 [Leptospira sp. GIMC2001]
MKQEIKLSLTTLITEDIKAARQFYEGCLNQIPSIDSENHVMYTSGFSLWERSYAENLVFGKKLNLKSGIDFSHEICFEAKALKPLEEFLLDKNVPFVNPLTEQPWGQLVMRIRDPDGRVIELGEPLLDTVSRIWLETGKNKEITSERTHIPMEVLDSYLPI